jgi:hypothetical protein
MTVAESPERHARMLVTRQLATVVLLIALVAVAPGWYLGFHAPAAYVAFWLLNTLALLDAWLLFDAFFPSDRLHDACIRIFVLTFALIAACGLVLGFLKLLTPVPYAALLLTLLLILARRKSQGVSTVPVPNTSMRRFHPVMVLIPPVLVFVLCFALTHPPVAYDSLTYHMFFPARWLQEHQISIIPTPFGDQAPAYAPGNGELFFLWLMLPFHGDLLARAGQFPFYCLCALTLYGLARRLGSPSTRAVYASGFFLLARPIIDQAVGADVDLVLAATFLTAVYFGLTASQTGKRSDIVVWGISIGLCFGTKVLGIIYSPLLFAFVFAKPIRRRAVWALPGIVALAAPWYIRNWVVAGSPLYPVSLTFAGLTIAPGAWERSVSSQNWAHLTDFNLLPGFVRAGAFGPDLLTVWVPFALLGTWALLRKRLWVALSLALLMPVLMGAIYWYVVPYNDVTDTRFLFAGVGLAMLLAPAAFDVSERLAPFIHVGLAAAMLWLVGLSGGPLVTGRYLLLYAVLAGLATVFHLALFRGLVTAVASFSVVSAATLLFSLQACAGGGCPLVHVSSFERPTMFAGWAWIEQHASHATMAYSGNNVPYRLLGPHFENSVVYVNIDRHVGWLYHDYVRAAKRRPDYTPPQRPSPPYFRWHGDFDEWTGNLRRLNVDYLFLTRMSVLMEADYFRDEAGFPIEATWAAAHPQTFVLVYENPEVKIYSISR